jgi:hypothetical protein
VLKYFLYFTVLDISHSAVDKLSLSGVNKEIDQNDEVIVVGNEKQKVQDAVSLLQKEIGKLTKQKWSCEVFDPRDIQAKLQSDIIQSLENRDIPKCLPNIRFQFAITVYKVFAHSKSLFCDR